ncbi:MAG: hypothetical protein AAFR84_09735 [Pseudomonadota bacterium]
MKEPWVRWLAFAVLAVTVLVSSCQALADPVRSPTTTAAERTGK